MKKDSKNRIVKVLVGGEWNGAENVDERTFDKLKTVRIYDDGRIEVDLNEEKKTA